MNTQTHNQTLQEFKKQQDKNKQTLNKLLHFVQEGENLGVTINESYKEKLENAINQVEHQKLRVALIGGFSEGKTSIASAWLEKLEDSMKISQQESSNEVRIYNVDDKIELVDTPGLFGFKEKNVNGNIQKYKDITKQYVSESHLVLYVLNSSNPIKESHKDDLIWLFRELNLLSRTIFVLSRFDEIADVEDENDYQRNLAIKRENVTQRLDEFLNLTDNEKQKLSIVAVSANPFGEGIEHWLQNLSEFKKLSHIDTLRQQTQEKIKENGGQLAIIEDTKQSIVQDIILKEIPKAQQEYALINIEVEKLQKLVDSSSKSLTSLNSDISNARIKLRESITEYFSDLCLRLSGADPKSFNDIIEKEIGKDCINVNAKIQNEFERYTEPINRETKTIETKMIEDIGFFEKTLTSYGKEGAKYVARWIKDLSFTNTGILAARDMLSKGLAKVGIDWTYKFAPHGAKHLAATLTKAIPIIAAAIPIILEIVDSYRNSKKEQEFKEEKTKIKDALIDYQKEILDSINNEEAFKKNFPQVTTLENALRELKNNLQESEQKQQEFQKWVKYGEAIQSGEIIDAEIIEIQ